MSKQSKWMMGCGTLAVVNVVSILFVLGLIFGERLKSQNHKSQFKKRVPPTSGIPLSNVYNLLIIKYIYNIYRYKEGE